MPRHWLATKGAEGRDRPRGAVFRLRSAGARMGKPGAICRVAGGGTHAPPERTPGTETSKYREEKKENRFRQ